MTYKIRPGIILLRVCDANLLVAEHKLWSLFPSVRPITKKQVVLWTLMEDGQNSNDALASLSRVFNKPYEEICQRFESILTSLAAEGYLIPVEEEEQ